MTKFNYILMWWNKVSTVCIELIYTHSNSHGHLYCSWYLAEPTNPRRFNRFSASSLIAPILSISAFTWFHHFCFGLPWGRLPSGLDFRTFFTLHLLLSSVHAQPIGFFYILFHSLFLCWCTIFQSPYCVSFSILLVQK